jgi:hypothetical protein
MKREESSVSHSVFSQLGTLIALVLCIVVLLTGLLVVRIHRSGQEALAASEHAFDGGDLEGATNAARESLTWYIPGAPHVALATARLRSIAIGAEATGDTVNALRAWEALRGGLFETAHPWSHSNAAFEEASAGVARLLAHQSRESMPTAMNQAEVREEIAAFYRTPAREPGRDWFAVGSSAGMLLMLAFGARVLSGRQFSSAAALVFTRAGLLVGVSLWVLSAVGY